MSDKDQPEASTDSDLPSGPADDSMREGDAREPESELPSFDAYGDDEEWSALDDDESLSGDPEWTGDDLTALEPSSPEEPGTPPPAAASRDTDSHSLFEDDDFEDETVSLSTDDEYLTDRHSNASSTVADFDEGALAGKHDDPHEDDDDHEDDDYEEDGDEDDDYGDDDYNGPASDTPVRGATQRPPTKPKKARWIWPTVAATLGLAVIGTGGYGWFHAMEQSKTIRSLEFQLKRANQAATVEPVAEQGTLNNERIDELQRELALAQERHADEISELAAQNQTLNAKLSSTERALLQARADSAPATPDKTDPQKAQNSPALVGTWFINIQTFSKQTDAVRFAESLSGSPENIQVQPVNVDGRTLYRVRAEGYPDKAEADAAAETLAQDFGLSKPWIGRQGS